MNKKAKNAFILHFKKCFIFWLFPNLPLNIEISLGIFAKLSVNFMKHGFSFRLLSLFFLFKFVVKLSVGSSRIVTSARTTDTTVGAGHYFD